MQYLQKFISKDAVRDGHSFLSTSTSWTWKVKLLLICWMHRLFAKLYGLPFTLGERISSSNPVFEIHEATSKVDGDLAENEGPDGTIKVVTEYAVPLDGHLARNGPLKPEEVQWGLVCLARALGFMHSSKLVHGSLSPSSVFVTPGGDWKTWGISVHDTTG